MGPLTPFFFIIITVVVVYFTRYNNTDREGYAGETPRRASQFSNRFIRFLDALLEEVEESSGCVAGRWLAHWMAGWLVLLWSIVVIGKVVFSVVI